VKVRVADPERIRVHVVAARCSIALYFGEKKGSKNIFKNFLFHIFFFRRTQPCQQFKTVKTQSNTKIKENLIFWGKMWNSEPQAPDPKLFCSRFIRYPV
jgi:hypothetical protein